MAAQTISPPQSVSQGTKRSADDMDFTPTKRRRLYHRRHSTHYKQPLEADPLQHSQDESLFTDQLDRALLMVLHSAGFDSAMSSALERLRSSVGEYMAHFLTLVRQSMASSRRSQPLPQDFIFALVQNNLTSSDLLPHASLSLPPDITQPRVLAPRPTSPEPPNLEPILGAGLSGKSENAQRKYIPKSFPSLPSKHTWQETPVFSARETDPRKIRERATEEGVLAEQALRKLAAAKKSQTLRRASGVAAPQGRAEPERKKIWEDALAAVLKEDAEDQKRHEERLSEDYFGFDGAADRPAKEAHDPASMELGMLVNYDRKNWRKSAQGSVAHA